MNIRKQFNQFMLRAFRWLRTHSGKYNYALEWPKRNAICFAFRVEWNRLNLCVFCWVCICVQVYRNGIPVISMKIIVIEIIADFVCLRSTHDDRWLGKSELLAPINGQLNENIENLGKNQFHWTFILKFSYFSTHFNWTFCQIVWAFVQLTWSSDPEV